MSELPGSSQWVEIAPGYRIRAPGLKGNARRIAPNDQAFRSEGTLLTGELEKALVKADIRLQATFELDVTRTPLPVGDGMRSTAGAEMLTREAEPGFALAVPALGPNVGYAALYTDEAGISRWFLPEPVRVPAVGASPGSVPAIVFHLPRPGAPAPPRTESGEASRGPIARIGRRLVRVLTWATDPTVGATARIAAKAWESSHRPYGFLRMTSIGAGGEPEWSEITKGRALLFLHGTFSTAEAAFGQFGKWDEFADLLTQYGNRAFAFNHPTLHASPSENMEQLCQLLPPGIDLECDVVTHSRGGLIARELIERVTDEQLAGRKLTIRRAVFVAGPLDGTALADGAHLFDFIDRYTNLLTALPDTAFTLTIEAVLTAVKLLAHGALSGLPGLQSMLSKGRYLSKLNPGVATQAQYHAIASSFTPTDPNLLARLTKSLGNVIIDKVFNEDNDCVVPTRGAFELRAAGGAFPIPLERRLVLGTDARVHHLNFFSNATVNRQIANWLASG